MRAAEVTGRVRGSPAGNTYGSRPAGSCCCSPGSCRRGGNSRPPRPAGGLPAAPAAGADGRAGPAAPSQDGRASRRTNAPAGVFDGRTGFFKDGAGLDLLFFGQALEPLVDIAVAARPVTAAVMPSGSRHERQQQERCHDQTTDNYILPHRQTLFCWAMLLAYQACVRGARKGRRQAVAFFSSFLVLAKNMQAKYPTAR